MLRQCLVLTLAITTTTIPSVLEGKDRSCVPGHRSNLPVMVGSTIRLVPDSVQGSEVVADAVAYWEACPGYGTGFPRFVTSEDDDADSVVPVRIETRLTGGRGTASPHSSQAQRTGRRRIHEPLE